jgi:SAM-dependent methyltransferase
MRSIAELKEALWNREQDKPLLYQPLEHPAFADWEAMQPCEERWEMIERTVDLSIPGTVVDLGCNTGWFCRKFSQYGWAATGIDKDPLAIEVATGIMKRWNGRPAPAYLCANLNETLIPIADLYLCLSLCMYLFPEKEPDVGWRFLSQLSLRAHIAFFDFGGMYSGHLPFTKETFPERLLQETIYEDCRLLGHTSLESRPFYVARR